MTGRHHLPSPADFGTAALLDGETAACRGLVYFFPFAVLTLTAPLPGEGV